MGHSLLRITNGLSLGSLSADPSPAANGDWYYNNVLGVYRAFTNGAWGNMLSSSAGGGSTNPLTQVSELDLITQPYTEIQVNDTGAKTFSYFDETNGPLPYNVWAQTGNMNTGRQELAGAGTQNSGLSFGGFSGSNTAVTEFYTGYTWTSTSNLNTARRDLAGSGTQSAALSFGGFTSANVGTTEKFNGSSWSSTGNMNTARSVLSGSGSQNAALSMGGNNGSSTGATEIFNGSTWAASGSLNTARGSPAGCGTIAATLCFGSSSFVSSTEKFNTSSWATDANMNTAKRSLGGNGTQNAAIGFAGLTTGDVLSATVEKFNGVSWYFSTSMNSNVHREPGGCGNQNLTLGFGGNSASASTEKFFGVLSLQPYLTFKGASQFIDNVTDGTLSVASAGTLMIEIKIVQNPGAPNSQDSVDLAAIGLLDLGDGLWSTTGSVLTARDEFGGCGTLNAALMAAGETGSGTIGSSEAFNGSAWAGSAPVNTARVQCVMVGSQYSALNFAGSTGSFTTVTELFNGLSWATQSNMNAARGIPASFGLSSAAGAAGGYNGSSVVTTFELFNGSTWSFGQSIPTATTTFDGLGSVASALIVGGNTTASFSSGIASTARFNGGSWFADASLLIALTGVATAGSPKAGLVIGGGNTSTVAFAPCQRYNGSAWIFGASQNAARFYQGGAGVQSAAVGFSGDFSGAVSAIAEIYRSQIPLPYTGVEFGKLSYVQNNLNTATIF
jgi:hypothetical protein